MFALNASVFYLVGIALLPLLCNWRLCGAGDARGESGIPVTLGVEVSLAVEVVV